MKDELIKGLEEHFGPMVEKPADMPIDDFCKMMRKLNTPPLDMKYVSDRYPYVNGTVWDKWHHRMILTYLDGHSFALIGPGRSIVGGGACVLNAQHWEDGKWLFHESELPERLKDWKCLGFWDGVEYPEAIEVPK